MKAVVERVARRSMPGTIVEVIDISADPELEAHYGLEIPVLLVNGKKAAKYRVTEDGLRRLLKPLVQGSDGLGSMTIHRHKPSALSHQP